MFSFFFQRIKGSRSLCLDVLLGRSSRHQAFFLSFSTTSPSSFPGINSLALASSLYWARLTFHFQPPGTIVNPPPALTKRFSLSHISELGSATSRRQMAT